MSIVPATSTWTNGFFIGSDNTGYEQARGAFWAMFTWVGEYGAYYTNGWLSMSNAIAAWQATLGGRGFGGMMGAPYSGGSDQGLGYTSNDLWLEIDTVTNGTAALVIHSPSYEAANAAYSLFYTTNLSPSISWQWVTNSVPGQSNLYVHNATDAQGFYRLGLTNNSAGTDFWATFPSAAPEGDTNAQLTLYISSQFNTQGTVSIPGLGFNNSFSLTAGTETSMAIPLGAIIQGYNVLATNGIHITASQPVSVYGLYYYATGSTAYTAYPTPMLGTRYCVMAFPSLVSDHYSQFAILGTTSGTTVTITPSTTAHLYGHSGTGEFTNYLQEGETCLFRSDNDGETGEGDVTGTWITSDKPIAVFAGASLARVPNVNSYSGNPLVQEQVPVAAWGNQALALSFGRGGDNYRILAASNYTDVTANDVRVYTLTNGEFYDVFVDGPVEFQGSNPIQVAQFARGGDTESGTGDPCEILLPPTGHYLTSYTVAIPTNDYVTGDFDTNFLNLIVPQSAITATSLDGAAITNFVALVNFAQVGSSGYSAARVPVAPGSTHQISSSQPIEVQVYGFSVRTGQTHGYDAYGYLGGLTRFP